MNILKELDKLLKELDNKKYQNNGYTLWLTGPYKKKFEKELKKKLREDFRDNQ